MFQFAKLDSLILLLLGSSLYLSSIFCLLTLGSFLLHYNLFWTFLHTIIGRRLTPRPFLVLTTSRSLHRRL
jgi:hypothetical protein